MEQILVAAFLADPAVAALVGTRVNFDRLPDRKALPALIVHELPSAGISHTQAGREPTIERRVQVDAWATTKGESIALRAAAIAVLDGLKRGRLSAWPQRLHTGWDYAAGASAADRTTSLYRASVDARLWHHETA